MWQNQCAKRPKTLFASTTHPDSTTPLLVYFWHDPSIYVSFSVGTAVTPYILIAREVELTEAAISLNEICPLSPLPVLL